ncbi:MAG: hypothetical protein IKV77_09665 [Alistipes sp.]|nr:hypothetical protein [Alistipes sp.]
MSRRFKISVRSNFAELWRYNIVVTCGAFDAAGEQIEVTTSESSVASIEDAAGGAADVSRDVKLTTVPCESIKAYVYLMPHKLPSAKSPEDTPAFGVRVKVKADDEQIYNVVHSVNQWSGATIELKLPKKE